MAKPAPVTNEKFLSSAKPLSVVVGENVVGNANPKTFSSGSVGFGFVGKMSVEIDGVPTPCQVGLNITVIGSKPGVESEAA